MTHRILLLGDRGRGLERQLDHDVLSVGDSALNAAREIGLCARLYISSGSSSSSSSAVLSAARHALHCTALQDL